jgi:hypothetical protein
MKHALIALVTLGVAAAFCPSAQADNDDQHHEVHHHYRHHHYHDQDHHQDHQDQDDHGH